MYPFPPNQYYGKPPTASSSAVPVYHKNTTSNSTSTTFHSSHNSGECSICADEYSISPFVIHPCRTCTKRTVCDNCLVNYLDQRINNNHFREIRCIDENCNAVMDSSHILEYLRQLGGHRKNSLVDRYDRFLLNAFMSTQDGFIWCEHNCGDGFIHFEKEKAPIVTCKTCHRKTC